MSHLTPEQIARYASRSGDVDEILDVAQHLENCSECRDAAAAIIDMNEDSGARRVWPRRTSGPRPAYKPDDANLLIWLAAGIVLFLAIAAFLFLQK